MRLHLGGLCALAAIVIAGDCAMAANSSPPLVRQANVETPGPSFCLGGVLNERPTGSYLTLADFPLFAALVAGGRRALICGDSIPAFLPSSQRAGFTSRHH